MDQFTGRAGEGRAAACREHLIDVLTPEEVEELGAIGEKVLAA